MLLNNCQGQGQKYLHLEEALALDEYVAPDILILLGRAYQYNLDFDAAIEKYNALWSEKYVLEDR